VVSIKPGTHYEVPGFARIGTLRKPNPILR
jgi:hypothetical protein